MAKGKHATALFEVMHGARRGGRSPTPEQKQKLLSTPKWWFKGRPGGGDDVGVGPIAPAAVAAPARAAPPVRIPPPAQAYVPPPPAPVAVRHEPVIDRGAASRNSIDYEAADASASKLRLNGVGGVLAVAGVVALLGGAYYAGSRMNRLPFPMISSETTEQLQAGPAHPAVLDVTAAAQAPALPTKVGPMTAGAGGPMAALAVPTTAKTWNDPKPSVPLSIESPNRVVALNYVIVQSYPDEKSAADAVEILARNAIACTIVKGPPGWANNSWFSVVGTRGFDKLRNNAEYDAYVRKIQRVSDAFAGKSRFKQFDPRPYRWKDTSGGPTATAR